MSRVLGNILYDLDPQGQGQIMYFFCKCIFSLTIGCSNIKLCWCIGHMKLRVLGDILCDLDPLARPGGQGQIIYFLRNASP